MKLVICPYSQKLPEDKKLRNPKNYPYWKEVLSIIKAEIPDIQIIQVGAAGEDIIEGVTDVNLNYPQDRLLELIKDCDAWMSVDNFFQHFCSYYKIPNGFVMFGQSDPNIFGYPFNRNILRDRKYLREHQFHFWWQTTYKEEVFASAEVVAEEVLRVLRRA
jgi:hypothetical protein